MGNINEHNIYYKTLENKGENGKVKFSALSP